MKARNNIFKKLTAWFLTLTLLIGVVGVLPVSVLAEEASATVEAKWGADASSLTGEGTFEEAVAAVHATDEIDYVQLQGDVTVGRVDWKSQKAVTLDLAGYTLELTGIHYVNALGASLTVTDTSAEGSGVIVKEGTTRIFEVQFEATLILDKVRLLGNDIYGGSESTVIVKKDVRFEQLTTFIYPSVSATLDLSEVTDAENIQIETYDIGDPVQAEDLPIMLPEGKMLYHNGFATDVLVYDGVYTIGAISEEKINYTFSAGEGTGSMEPVEAYCEIVLPEPDFTAPEGKMFQGWQVNGDVYAAGELISVTEDTVITALWATPVTVSFDANGGTGTMDGQSMLPSTVYTLPQNSFTAPKGKMFDAWQIGETRYVEGDTVTVTEDVTVKALWQEFVPQIVIKMKDNYGDGWNNASIEVYQNGTQITTATITAGAAKTVVLDYNSTAEYSFKWISGMYDSECSFEILINDNSVFSCMNGRDLLPNEAFYTHEGIKSVSIEGASVSIGKDLSMNYYVKFNDETLLEYLDQIKMHFTFNEKTYTVFAGEKNDDGQYPFVLTGIAPHQMGDAIKAELKRGNEVLDVKESYTIKENAQSLLDLYYNDDTAQGRAIVQLVSDMLYYGAAAQTYTGHNTSSLVTSGVNYLSYSSAYLLETTDLDIDDSASTTAYFTAAGVYFNTVNRLYVKLSTAENVSLAVKKNGETVGTYTTFEDVDGSVVFRTDAIYATSFDDVYTFSLYEGDALVQTLTYSVKSYVYAMQETEGMADLVQTLYAYGTSAVNYKLTGDEDPLNSPLELQAAINAGGTVVLSGNLDLGDNGVYVNTDVTVTLDLNGYELTSNAYITIENQGNLTVIDSSESGTGKITSDEYAVHSNLTGTLTVTGGTFIGEYGGVYSSNDQITITGGTFSNDPLEYLDTDAYHSEKNADGTYTVKTGAVVVDTYEELKLFLNRGGVVVLEDNVDLGDNYVHVNTDVTVTLDLNGYELTSGAFYAIYTYGNLTVIDSSENGTGKITAVGNALYNEGTLTVTGGTFIGLDGAIYSFDNPITITGGTFSHDPLKYLDIDAYHSEKNADGTYTVKTGAVAVDTYEELKLLLNRGGTVVLKDNIDLGENYILISEGVIATLNLNGYELTTTAYYAVYSYGNLTVIDSSESGTGKISAIDYAVANSSGTLTVAGGTFIGGLEGVYSANDQITITGGTFSSDPLEYLDTDAYHSEKNADGTYTVKEGAAVIDVNAINTFEKLNQAISAGGTVVLGNHIDLGGNYILIPEDVTVTLDLNGYELTSVNSYAIANSGNLTVIDSSENGTGKVTSSDIVLLNDGGTLTVAGGTFIGGFEGVYSSNDQITITGGTFSNDPLMYLDTDAYHSEQNADGTYTVKAGAVVIDTYEELQLFINRGGTVVLGSNIDLGERHVLVPEDVTVTLDLNGYELISGAFYAVYNYGNLTVIDSSENGTGKITAVDHAMYNSGGVMTVAGGTFIGGYDGVYSSNDQITITGGTFSHDPLEYLDTDAYHSEQNTDGTYTVKAGAVVIDTYEKLQMFIDRGGTVVLGGNIDLGENSVYVNGGVTVTLDLNGYELTTTTYNVIYNYGTLILIDSSENGTGKIVAQDDEVYNGGVLTVTGGTFGHNPLKHLDTDAYHSEKNADGTYTVKAGATVIDTHEELQLFINRGGTVVLEGNVDMGENHIKNPEGTTVILDLNGYELTSTMFYAIDNPGNLTVIDSSENGTGKITGADYGVYNGGVLTVTGGTFIGKYHGVYSTNDQLTITGGTFSNDPTQHLDTDAYHVEQNADGTYTVKAISE